MIFAEMKAIIEAVPEFEARCNIQRYGKVIEVMEGDGAGSIYESLSADDKRAHGLSPSFWVFDEYAQAPNSDLLDNLRTAMGKRVGEPRHRHLDAGGERHAPAVAADRRCGARRRPVRSICSSLRRRRRRTSSTKRLGSPATKRSAKFLDLNEFRAQAEQAKRLPSLRAKFENLRLNRQNRRARAVHLGRGLDGLCRAARHAVAGRQAVLRRARSIADNGYVGAGAVLAAQRRRAAILLVARKKACSIAIARRADTIGRGATPACSKRRRARRSISRRSSVGWPRSLPNTISFASPMTAPSSRPSTPDARRRACACR